ncbi:mucin-5AC [Toxotes jaculatrix]|uniref:mucin-5AC n=1 Tax=Toxotes jaculatrix TaxID=941984 RepID=UPI001B3B0C5E|nr:mucin-5AC [Toxotes jaculatrix]
MSTSDAGELELRQEFAPRECSTARAARNKTSRAQLNHHGAETPTGQDRHLSAISPKGPHTALTPGAGRDEGPAHRAGSEVQVQRPSAPRFTSSLFLTLSRNLSLDKPELKRKPAPESCPHSLPEPQRAETEDSCCQANRRTPPETDTPAETDAPAETDTGCPSPEAVPFPATREGGVITAVCNELDTNRDLSVNHSLSNGDCGPRGSGSEDLEEDIKDCTKLEDQKDLDKLSSPAVNMLSSTVVTVLAPHWSGRLRRNKRFEGTGNLDGQGNLQDVSNSGVETDGPQAQLRVPPLGTRRNVVDWSTKSGPARLDFESKRQMSQMVSVVGDSGRMDNRKLGEATAGCPLSLNHGQALSALSSKPTTSSLLLSLRRVNSSGRTSNAATTFSEEHLSAGDPEGNLSTAHVSQNHRDRNTSESHFFSTPPLNKDTGDTPFTPQPQTCPRQAFLSRAPSARKQNSRSSDKNTNLFPERSVPAPRHSPYDSSALLKTHSLPRRTTLTSTSWWKQVTPEGHFPVSCTDTLSGPACDGTRDVAFSGPTDSQTFGAEILSNRDDNNTPESVCRGNVNVVMKTQGGTHSLKQRHAEESHDHTSDRQVQQQHGSIVNGRDAQKPQNRPDVWSAAKISRTTAQPALSKDLSRREGGNRSFTAKGTELPPPLLHPKSCAPPTESSGTHSLSATVALSSQAVALKTSSSFLSHPVPASLTGSSSQKPKFTSTASATLLGFERSYASVPKSFQPKTASSLIPTVTAPSKANYGPAPTASITSSPAGSHPAATAAPSPSLLTPPAIPSSPTTVSLSSLLTPPATPIITSPSYSEMSSPQEGRTFSSSPERNPNKLRPQVEGKRVRRVTWEDSVDLRLDPSVDPASPLSPSRSPRSVRAPSIFSFLRSGSPTTNTPPLCPPTPKTSSIQVGKGGKYRSLSSDSADLTSRGRETFKQKPGDATVFDQIRWDLTTPRQERALSVESAPRSLPPDFSGAYKLRYSSPPYSTLMSSRSTQGETKTKALRSPLLQQTSRSVYTPHLPSYTDPGAVVTMPTPKPPVLPVSSPQTFSLSLQSQTATQASSKFGVLEEVQVDNNPTKNSSQGQQRNHVSLVDSRVHISSQCSQVDKTHSCSSTCVTETLVYSLKSKADPAAAVPKTTALRHTADSAQSQEASPVPRPHSDQSSSGSSSQDDGRCGGRTKENVLNKSRFFSVESSSEQSSKRSRFTLRKSVSTPNPTVSRSDSERVNRTNNRMDQVLHRLRQTFSSRRSEDDLSFPWRWRRASQTPSVSVSSDVSSVSDVTADSTKTVEEREQEGAGVLRDDGKGTEGTNRWTQNRYTIIPPSAGGGTAAGDQFSIWSDQSEPEQDEQQPCAGHTEHKTQVRLSAHSPTVHPFDFYKDNRTDHRPTNQFPSCTDPSPGRSPNSSAGYPTQFRKSASSPRSPFSPFSSLSPLSPFSSPDVTDDSVFYSPKLQRRRESSSPCEPGEGIGLGGSRRSRASTGPPSAAPAQNNEHLASSYADLKYGIEPGRSFSVSSVLSSRPSGPGRISTGSRFMSVGDLSESSLSCRGTGKDLDQWSSSPEWTTEYGCLSPSDRSASCLSSDPGKMRSRSLPRSLTRRLANWSSGISVSEPVTTAVSKPAHLLSPNMDTCLFGWDTEGPPTPPPTPPLSPVSRRMSKPPGLSPTTFPSSSGAPQSVDSLSSRGHLPSRGYVSSLSTFEESSDSSSDTTTDDEYYLETGEGEEKETEL